MKRATSKALLPAALFTASVIVIAPTAFFFMAEYSRHEGGIEAESQVTAHLLSEFVSRNPRMWYFEEDRIRALLEDRTYVAAEEGRRVLDGKGEPVVDYDFIPPAPLITGGHPLKDSGEVVGKVEIVRSLRPLFRESAFLMLILSLPAAALVTGAVSAVRAMERSRAYREEAEEKLQSYQKKLQALTAELSTTAERQREECASILHDEVTQLLVICKVKMESPLPSDPAGEGARDIRGARELLSLALEHTRSLTSELSSHILQELGLREAVEKLCEEMENEHGITCAVLNGEAIGTLPRHIGSVLYRSIRELLTNVVRHAGAAGVHVTFARDGERLEVYVTDDGGGYDADTVEEEMSTGEKYGLFSIREAMGNLGGEFDMSPVEGGGTRVRLTVPLGWYHDASPEYSPGGERGDEHSHSPRR